MFLLGVLFMTATALAHPTVYVARSSVAVAYPSYRMYLEETIPEVEISKEPETNDEPDTELIPEAPLLEPLPIESIPLKSVEIEAETSKEESSENEKVELENKSEEERKEEILKEEGPIKVESEEEKKVEKVPLEVTKPIKFFTSFISGLSIKLPSFELPFNLGSLWKPNEKQIRFVPAYGLRELVPVMAE